MAKSSEEGGLFQSPQRLIATVILAFVVPISIAAGFAYLASSGRKGYNASEEDIAKRIQPVARVEMAGAQGQAPAAGAKSSEEIYNSVCAACHGSGAAGAPKLGDKAAWAPRIGQGLDKLVASALHGKGAMPPKGGATNLSDNEVSRAVVFMANKAGANFKEPAASAAPAAAAAASPQSGGPASAAAPQSTAPSAPAAAVSANPTPAAAPPGGASKGKSVYDATCAACHGAGVAGAPKLGDKTAWTPRLAAGVNGLTASAIKGKNAMPPKGGNASLSDADVKAAVEYMVSAAK